MKKSKVLVAPMDWGLGHATRCIPVVHALLARSCDVVLAGSGASLALLKSEFPSLPFYGIIGYEPQYPAKGSMVWKMARQIPHFVQAIRTEHRQVQHIIEKEGIDRIISDNRYGCWSRRIPSVLITHQSNVLMPKRFGWLAPLVRFLVQRMLRRFDTVWAPDFPDRRLAGDLLFNDSQGRAVYIGPLSRFKKPEGKVEKKYEVVAVFSGPEPQRTILEGLVTEQLMALPFPALLVRGLPGKTGRSVVGNFTTVDFMGSEELGQTLLEANFVLARSGYSTVMDMMALGLKPIFVPTPGQTEQEYLARQLKDRGVAYAMRQRGFDLQKALAEASLYPGFSSEGFPSHYLEKAIDTLLHG